jgi:hypothetical protein
MLVLLDCQMKVLSKSIVNHGCQVHIVVDYRAVLDGGLFVEAENS